MPPSNNNGNPTLSNTSSHINAADNGGGSDSEESALIVWEDETSNLLDLRHLLNSNSNDDNKNSNAAADGTSAGDRQRLPIAMTQQIEELSFGTVDSDDDDKADNVNDDTRDGSGSGSGKNNGADGVVKAGSTSSGATTRSNAKSAATKSCNETMTPPPENAKKASVGGNNNLKKNKLMHSGEVPATISKLRRRKRGRMGREDSSAAKREKKKQVASTSTSLLPTIHEHDNGETTDNTDNAMPDNKNNKKQKLSAGQEVDRVFDFLGVPNKQPHQQLSLSQSQAMENNINEELKQAATPGIDKSTSPLGQRKLFLQRSHTHPPHPSQPHQNNQQQRRIKLPPLGRRRFDDNLEKENESNQTSDANNNNAKNEEGESGKDIMEEDGCDLFREIELGLDRVICNAAAKKKASSADTTKKESTTHDSTAHDGVKNVSSLANSGSSKNLQGSKIGSFTQPLSLPNTSSTALGVHPSICVSANVNYSDDTKIGLTTGTHGVVKNNAVGGVAAPSFHQSSMTNSVQCHLNNNANKKKKTEFGNNTKNSDIKKEDDEFGNDDEDWNDEDLAAIDLSVAMTQSHNHGASCSSLGSSTPGSSQPVGRQQRKPAMRHSAPLPLQRSASLPPAPAASASNNLQQRSASIPADAIDGPIPCQNQSNDNGQSNEFDDDEWNDDDLAAIDLSVSMTQSHCIKPSTSSTHQEVKPASSTTPNNTFNNVNNATTNHSEFSDDDFDDCFAEVDFNALDNKIVQHKLLMTQQHHHPGGQCNVVNSSQPAPPPIPPIMAPVHNRRHTIANGSNGSFSPSFLSFTRYIVQSVQEDLATYTKTIGVSLWKSPSSSSKHTGNGGGDDEQDRLRKIISSQTSDGRTKAVIEGYMHIRGEWYHTDAQIGDIFHLCSLSGAYVTDTSALPLILHTHPPPHSDPNDDLVLVIHPDELISPTLVSENVKCSRLAVLQSRMGSTGLSSKPAVIGTLRHDLFERCLQERDTTHKSAALFTRQIIRNNASALLGCGIHNQREGFGEVIKTLPQIQRFLQAFTSWNVTTTKKHRKKKQMSLVGGGGGVGGSHTPDTLLEGMFPCNNTLMEIKSVYSTEEWAHVPELGLKGNVDATVLARTKSTSSQGKMQDVLMPVELKTGHYQNPSHNHLAQLSTYTFMLRARHGSACSGVEDNLCPHESNSDAMGAAGSGMLLYLNHKNYCARHVKPSACDFKTLIGQRNIVVCDVLRTARPRGIAIEYEKDANDSRNSMGRGSGRRGSSSNGRVVVNEPPPPSALPQLQPSISSCERCYKNRECMMYASADNNITNGSNTAPPLGNSGHGRLLQHFTGHLTGADLEYFSKWDRLIDLERHASAKDVISKSWLFESGEKETRDGKCISSLVLDEAALSAAECDDRMALSSDSGRDDNVSIRFVRSNDSAHHTPLTNLSIDVGSYVIVSEDGTSFVRNAPQAEGHVPAHEQKQHSDSAAVRHKMHILKAAVTRIGEQSIEIAVPKKDVGRIKRLVKSFNGGPSNNVGTHQRNNDIRSNNNLVKFRLDKDEYGSGVGQLLQNLVNFFTLDIPSFSAESFGTPAKTKSLTANTENSARRRRLASSIIRLEPPPRFLDVSAHSLFTGNAFALDVPGCDPDSLKRDFGRLNSDQKAAVLKAISAEDFSLIQGLPGTGKSATIAFVTRLLVSRGKRVLLTSYTHSAVDNLLCKLMDSGVVVQSPSHENAPNPIVRIGRESSCHLKVQPLLAENVALEAEMNDFRDSSLIVEKPSVEYLHKVISAAKVIGVSALTAPRSPLLAGQHFDCVIVDEAGQISQPALLGAIMAADSFVLVGDHMQLPPLVVSKVAEEAGYGVSMLMHLAEGFPNAVAKLTMQYRMNEEICHLSNIIAYKGQLKCGNDNVRHQKLDLTVPKNLNLTNPTDRQWIERAIDPGQPVIFLDTDRKGWLESSQDGKGAGGPINEKEASIVQNIVLSLTSCGINNSSIGVITPFRSQLRLLNENPALQESKSNGLEICTIDRFQGRDKSAIVISLVRSNNEGKAGRLLQDFRRLNVAFSRAKKKMIIIGSFSTLHRGSDVMRPVLESLQQRNWIYKLPV